MEATTYQTAALIDRGAEDYMLETAILKVFSTEVLWQGVYETLQVYGGQGYFSNEPYERMMRDARINTIGEGANEVLKAFIALVGMRDIGEGLKATLDGLKRPGSFLPTLWNFTRGHLGKLVSVPTVPVASADAAADGRLLSRRVARFGRTVERLLITHREAVLERQYIQERIADAAIALVTSACTLSRWDRSIARPRDPVRAIGRRAVPAHGQPPLRRVAARPELQRRPPDDRGRGRRAADVGRSAGVKVGQALSLT